MILTDIAVRTIETPLKQTYNLSYRPLTYYDSVIVELFFDNGEKVLGEVTPLPSYSSDTVQSVCGKLSEWSGLIRGQTQIEAVKLLENYQNPENSFALSALMPPLELYPLGEKLDLIPVDWLINAFDCSGLNQNEIEAHIQKIIKEGYKTIKIKLGQNFENDINVIRKLANVDFQHITIRFDANCGYDKKQAERILGELSENLRANTEYLEQPLARDEWKNTGELVRAGFPVQIMLDEAIYGIDDIYKARDIGISFVKLKLCKTGSISNMRKILEMTEQHNINVVLGNGVATDISNFFELLFYKKNRGRIWGASESVGFLKLQNQLAHDLSVAKY